MSFFSEVFGTDGAEQLPEWMRTGAAIVDEGLDLYERVSGGDESYPPPVMQSSAPAPVSPFALTGVMGFAIVAVGLYLFLGIARRR